VFDPRQAAKLIAVNALVLVLLALLVEGGSRVYLACNGTPRQQGQKRVPAERLHAEYDPLLGWINRKNVVIDDMYGPGIFLRTNGQRFRNEADFAPEVPAGKIRVICSGDSFTLGYGVSNDDAWCNRLARLDPGIEAVNMGQGGYGVDQSFLWYERDGAALKHDIHVFAFIAADFRRMRSNFRGFGKPVLRLRDGQISVENVPVPVASDPDAGGFLHDLAILKVLGRDVSADRSAGDAPPSDTREIVGLVRALVDRIDALGRERNAKVLLVHLPTLRDHPPPRQGPALRQVREQARRRELAYLDLTEAMRVLPAEQARSLFILAPVNDYYRARGHYNEAGHAFVAERILDALREHGFVPAQPAE